MDTGTGSAGSPIFKTENCVNSPKKYYLALVALHTGFTKLGPEKDGVYPGENHGVLMSEVVKHMKGKRHKKFPVRIMELCM